MPTKKLILASQSPRRKELLQKMGFEFTTISLDIDESFPENLQRGEITEFLAKEKAKAYTNLKANEILITSDTIVWHNHKTFEKPKNQSEALDMILALSNTTHSVYSSVCVKTLHKEWLVTDEVKVTFASISKAEALNYIKTHQPFDKAGSYGIQEGIGLTHITEIKGNYYTVMGLPTHLVYDILKKALK